MSTTTELLSSLTYAIEEVSRSLAKVPPNFGLLVARFLQATPFNYGASTQTLGENRFHIFVDEFKQRDWMFTIAINGDFTYAIDGPHPVSREFNEVTEAVVPAVEGPEIVGISVKEAMDVIKHAIATDEGYAWSWQSNIAMPIVDDLGIDGKIANRCAARLLRHFFGYDITKQKEYIDRMTYQEVPVAPDEVEGDDVNTLHISCTGFQANSGAETVARGLTKLFQGYGYDAVVNIASTTLSEAERSQDNPVANTRIVVTGVESRWHTDRSGPSSEEGVDVAVADLDEDPNCPTDDDSDAPFDTEEPESIFGSAVSSYIQEPKLVLKVSIPEHECNPTLIVDALRDQYPDAVLKVKIKLDNFGCDSIKIGLAQRKALTFTIDPADPDPKGTVDFIQREIMRSYGLSDKYKTPRELFEEGFRQGLLKSFEPVPNNDPGQEVEDLSPPDFEEPALGEDTQSGYAEPMLSEVAEPSLTMTQEKMQLSDPEHRRNAYLFDRREGDQVRVVMFHVAVDEEGFDVEQILGEGYTIVEASPSTFYGLLESISPEVVRYSAELYENNARWINRFGNGEEVSTRHHEGPFTLFNISQGSIPKAIYADIEECWTAFQNVDRLPELADCLNDPTIVIGVEDYVKVTRGGMMIVREHPRLEELFLKYIKFKALNNPQIDRWIKSFGL
jgi:hypothetical protein